METRGKTHGRVWAFAAILFCFILFGGCKKETPLPQATQTGANTLGCRINGKVWVAEDSDEMFNRAFGVEGGYQRAIIDTLRNCIWIQSRKNDRTGLQLYVRKVNKPGVYPLNFNTGISPGTGVPKNYGYYYDGTGRYVTGSRYTGTVNITRADTVTGIISGAFEFTAYDAKTKQTITVTEGRFDLDGANR